MKQAWLRYLRPMGNFYTNYSVLTADTDRVREKLIEMKRKALITPARNGVVVIFDAGSESQDPDEIEQLGTRLSKALSAPVVSVLVHDDDLMLLWITTPSGFSGSYGKTFDAPVASIELARVTNSIRRLPLIFMALANPFYVFQSMRHARIVKLCRLNKWAVGTGYEYLMLNDYPEGLTRDMLIST